MTNQREDDFEKRMGMVTTRLIFYYHRINTYSFNALAGAIDTVVCSSELAGLQIELALTADDVLREASVGLESCSRVIVALSIMSCQFEDAARLTQRLREKQNACHCASGRLIILAGGPHVTAHPEDVLRAGVDIVFRGEAERSFPRVLRDLLKNEAGEECPAIQSADVPTDLNDFCSFSPSRGMFGPIEITRGCAFACRFCQTSQIFGVRLRHRNIDKVIEHTKMLHAINRKVVRLLSPNAFSYGSEDGRKLNLLAIRELLSGLREAVPDGRILFAHFPSEARPEHVTPDTLALLKEFADNDEIVIGAQSGSARMLEHCGRSHTVEDILTAVRLARRHGYKIIVDFMFGLPGETDVDRHESLAVMKEVVALGARIHPHIFAPLPQTAFSREPPGEIAPFFLNAFEAFRRRRAIYENAPRSAEQC